MGRPSRGTSFEDVRRVRIDTSNCRMGTRKRRKERIYLSRPISFLQERSCVGSRILHFPWLPSARRVAGPPDRASHNLRELSGLRTLRLPRSNRFASLALSIGIAVAYSGGAVLDPNSWAYPLIHERNSLSISPSSSLDVDLSFVAADDRFVLQVQPILERTEFGLGAAHRDFPRAIVGAIRE